MKLKFQSLLQLQQEKFAGRDQNLPIERYVFASALLKNSVFIEVLRENEIFSNVAQPLLKGGL